MGRCPRRLYAEHRPPVQSPLEYAPYTGSAAYGEMQTKKRDNYPVEGFAPMRQKLKSTSPTAASKKRKSVSPTPTPITEPTLVWHRHYQALAPDKQETIQRETAAARAAGGSRLAVAMHLMVVRRILRGDATNPKQKKLWSAYLAANLPGFCISRAQVFRDISAAEAAEETFPAVFLAEFISGGYALSVRPSVEEPIGKFTAPCKQILVKLDPEHLSSEECAAVLTEASAIIRAEAKKNRTGKTALTAEDKRESILTSLHNTAVSFFSDLAQAIEPGDSYNAMHVRDDLEEIVCRLMTALGVDALELRQVSLPDGFDRLSLPNSFQNSSVEEPSEIATAANAA